MRASSPFRPRRRRLLRGCFALVAAVGWLACGSSSVLAGPQATTSLQPVHPAPTLQDLIAEASARFGVPASWIAEVMSVESRGRPSALSPKGAIGLMQVMPDTYEDMRARYGLGASPWDPHDNVLAGAAYLRLLYDRYGAPGFLVAYNAGPGRWDDYRLRARALPAETVAYLARLGPVVGGAVLSMPTFAGWPAQRPLLASPIFVRLASASSAAPMSAERERIVRIIDANTSLVRPAETLFVASPRAADASPSGPSSDKPIIDQGSSGRGSAASLPTASPPRNPLFPERTNTGAKQ